MNEDSKKEQLRILEKRIISYGDQWWLFPPDEKRLIKGFLGTGPIFLVGDQPSTSTWNENNPNRILFYSVISALGLQNAHLTDIYKRRGKSSSLCEKLPRDFPEHINIFCEEVSILQPTKIVAMGHLAFSLIQQHLPELKPITRQVTHFAMRNNNAKSYRDAMEATLDDSGWPSR